MGSRINASYILPANKLNFAAPLPSVGQFFVRAHNVECVFFFVCRRYGRADSSTYALRKPRSLRLVVKGKITRYREIRERRFLLRWPTINGKYVAKRRVEYRTTAMVIFFGRVICAAVGLGWYSRWVDSFFFLSSVTEKKKEMKKFWLNVKRDR